MENQLQKQTAAVIDIGTSAIRLVIAEVGAKADIRYLENLQKDIRFGKDVFTTGRISHGVIREAIKILRNYKSVIETYGVKKIQAIATSAVREAQNRDTFIDQVYVQTGIDIEVLEGPEENRLELIAVEHALENKIDLENKNCLIVEIGSGSTEMILLNEGKVMYTRTLSFGTVRLPGDVVIGKTQPSVIQRNLKRSVHEITSYIAREYNLENVNTFIALGAEVRFVARQLQENIQERFVNLESEAFQSYVSRIQKMTPEEIASQYGLPYGQAETLYPCLLLYLYFFAEIQAAKTMIIPMESIRDALLLELAQFLSEYKRTDVSKQVVSSAKHLADKYKYDKAHASNVAALGLKLFDMLKTEHGMGTKERLLMEVSAILHDIGNYISPSGHHKHSSYLVSVSEIFGLRKTDKNIVANVVRYHRKASPRPNHVEYMSLPKADRSVVAKLAAMLRVANALDHSHQQKIKSFQLEKAEETYTLWIPAEAGDISLEREAVSQKNDLFFDVFGVPVHLKQQEIEK